MLKVFHVHTYDYGRRCQRRIVCSISAFADAPPLVPSTPLAARHTQDSMLQAWGDCAHHRTPTPSQGVDDVVLTAASARWWDEMGWDETRRDRLPCRCCCRRWGGRDKQKEKVASSIRCESTRFDFFSFHAIPFRSRQNVRYMCATHVHWDTERGEERDGERGRPVILTTKRPSI